jgi:hypothetical protein
MLLTLRHWHLTYAFNNIHGSCPGTANKKKNVSGIPETFFISFLCVLCASVVKKSLQHFFIE